MNLNKSATYNLSCSKNISNKFELIQTEEFKEKLNYFILRKIKRV